MGETEVLSLTALELRQRYVARELSPVEVLDASLERVDRVNGALNALVTPTFDLAREQALAAEHEFANGMPEPERGLLGIPLTVKDNIPIEGIRMTAGSLLLRDSIAPETAPAAERALAAGAVLLGKTNTPEFAWKGETTNRVFGTTRNPWNLARTPGGSSGGAAASVAAGIGPIALGTDGGGSIRIPAAYTGLFGFKPTFGLVPSAPNGPLETLGHTGILARTVRDAALVLTVVAGEDYRDRLSQHVPRTDWLAQTEGGVRNLRMGWSRDLGYAPIDDEVADLAADAAVALREAGAKVEEIEVDLGDPHDIFYVFFAAANAGMHRQNWENVRDLVDIGRAELIEDGFRLTAADVGDALIRRNAWTRAMLHLFEDYDLLLTPTMPSTAFEVGLDRPASVAGIPTPQMRWTPFTYGTNLTGQPSASLPCGFAADGLPVGLQVIGRRHDDATVLRACRAFEAAHPWRSWQPSSDT